MVTHWLSANTDPADFDVSAWTDHIARLSTQPGRRAPLYSGAVHAVRILHRDAEATRPVSATPRFPTDGVASPQPMMGITTMTRSVRFALVPLVAAAVAGAQDAPGSPRADSARRLPQVIVTATRDSIAALASPLPSATIGASALRRDHSVSLAATLERLPGVRSLSTGEQIGKPVIRGLSGARVLVLDDGLRLEDYSWSDEDAPSVDARLADRVEVIRGPASVLYGSDALGGVVNVLPMPLLDARGGPALRQGQVELYGASNNRETGGVLGLEGAHGRLGGRLLLVGRVGQNVRTPSGEIPNTGFLAGNGELAVGMHHEGGAESTLRVAHYGGEYQLLETDGPPGASPDTAGGPARVVLDDRLQLAHRQRLGSLDLELRGQLQRHLLQENSDVPNPAPGQPKEATVFDLLLNTATVDLLAHHGESARAEEADDARRSRGLHGTVGVSGLYQRNASRGIIPLVPNATIASGGAFAFEQLEMGRLALVAGARGDARRLAAEADPRLALTAQSRSSAVLTGDVGAVYRVLPSLAFSLNAGRAWRAPTLFELFANGPRLGEGRYEYGDPTLRPERSFNIDASLRWSTPRLQAEASAFRTYVRDFIFIAPTDTTRDNLRVYHYAQADARLVGGELAATVEVMPMATVRASLDGVRGTNALTADPLPLLPPLRAMTGVELRPSRWAGDPYATVEVEHVAAQTRLSQSEQQATVLPGRFPLETAAYTLVDLGVGVAVPVARRVTRLDLRVRNATNARYRDFLSRYKEFAYSPGANIVLRATTIF